MLNPRFSGSSYPLNPILTLLDDDVIVKSKMTATTMALSDWGQLPSFLSQEGNVGVEP